MGKYRVVVDRDQCRDSGLSSGSCPPHAKMLAIILQKGDEEVSNKKVLMGFFSEERYEQVKQLIDGCPEKALSIEPVTNDLAFRKG